MDVLRSHTERCVQKIAKQFFGAWGVPNQRMKISERIFSCIAGGNGENILVSGTKVEICELKYHKAECGNISDREQ